MSRGPAIPAFILRGHTSPVHALLFFDTNSYLASGDSDGWLVIWSLASKRPVAVWKAHSGGVSGVKSWGSQRLITHGRDHKLRVWKLTLREPHSLSEVLPVEGATDDQAQPWLLHSMDMGALNFCSFAMCEHTDAIADGQPAAPHVLIASPNGLDSGGVDIFQLPDQRRVSQIHSDKDVNTGMVMSIALHAGATSDCLWLLCGYEDGQLGVWYNDGYLGSTAASWQRVQLLKLHSQPVLSLSVAPSQEDVITSSADSQIAKLAYKPSKAGPSKTQPKVVDTKHAGQQGLSIRSDGKIFATAGWDSRVRVYSVKTMRELAVLKWHHNGCYSTAFADLNSPEEMAPAAKRGEVRAVATSALDIIKQERHTKAQRTHWLAAGGKDGKISLWDVY